MKETLNISVNGIKFIINTDAYSILRTYLNKVETTYLKEVGGREIISDIEARVAELLLSWQGDSGKVITKECADDIVLRLGEPDVEVGEPVVEEKIRPRCERRLYRSREGAMLGGVLSGMGYYFNMDTTIFRIFFVLLFIIGCSTGGTLVSVIFISYFIMWIIVPKAITARQKMEMRGEAVTVSSIENSIKREIDSVYHNPKNEKIASVFSNIIYIIGRMIKWIILFTGSIIGVVLLVILLSVVGAFAYMLTDIPFVEMCVEINPYIALSLVAIAIIAPLSFFVYLVIRVIFSMKWKKGLVAILALLWVMSWFAIAVLAAKEVSRFRENYTDFSVTEVVSSRPVLYINASDDAAFAKTNLLSEKCRVSYSCNQDTLLNDNIYRVEVTRKSNGRNIMEARYRALQIEDPLSVVSDSSVVVSPNIDFGGDDNVFYNQEVRVAIFYPKNGGVVIDDQLRGYDSCSYMFND